jgi:hypothetical protein
LGGESAKTRATSKTKARQPDTMSRAGTAVQRPHIQVIFAQDHSAEKREISIMLDVSAGRNEKQGVPMDCLSPEVHEELTWRIDAMRLVNKTRDAAYRKSMRNPDTYIDEPFCLYSVLRHNLKVPKCTHQLMPGMFPSEADFTCRTHNMPYLHFSKLMDGCVLELLPLSRQHPTKGTGEVWNIGWRGRRADLQETSDRRRGMGNKVRREIPQ